MKKLVCFLLLTFSSLFAKPAQVIIVRHGEKPADPDAIYLSARGLERSGAFIYFFQKSPKVLQFGPPVAIYAGKPVSQTKSQRPIQTMVPLSEALGLPIQSPFGKDQEKQLAQTIINDPKYDGRMVLISYVHKAMGTLVEAFGAPKPPHYPGNRFDLIYKITFTDHAAPTFCISLQELMFGDSSESPAGFKLCP